MAELPPPPDSHEVAPPPPPPAPLHASPGGGPRAQGTAPLEKPKSFLVFAILSAFFCCLPVGIAGVVFAAQVNSRWAGGDYVGAYQSSDRAKKCVIASVAIGGVVLFVYLVLFLGALAASAPTAIP